MISCTGYVSLLKACAKRKDLHKGTRLHADILKEGMETNETIGNALVDMFGKCGAFVTARQVLDELPIRSVVAHSMLIGSYVQHGHGEEALNCFELMQHEGVFPDVITFAFVLKACSIVRAIDKGEEIHAEIVRQGFLGKDIVLGNVLIDMYAKCGVLDKAQKVLTELHARNVVSWSTLIAGYAQHGLEDEALDCFERMQSEGVIPNQITLTCMLRVCGSKGAVDKGQLIQAEISKQGLLGKDTMLDVALVDMYIACGALAKAREVLHVLPVQHPVPWNALIEAYTQYDNAEEALNCFEHMQQKGHFPNAAACCCLLQACATLGAIKKGENLHAEIARRGLVRTDIVLGNAVVNFYAKCDALERAEKMLKELHNRNVVTWSTLISGYAQKGCGEEALNCFERMQQEKVSPNAVTFSCVLKACGSIGVVDRGEKIHAELIVKGLLGTDVVLDTSLVDMYCRCGSLVKAQLAFDELPVRHVSLWNALIAGYLHHEQSEDALNCFDWMQSEGLCPDVGTFISVLKACGNIGAADKGEKVYVEIVRQGLLLKSMLVNTLVVMYVKCGVLAKSQKVFNELSVHDGETWSVLIAGYAQHGDGKKAMTCFERMQSKGFVPNAISFGSLLNACSHSGLLDEAQVFFENMRSRYSIVPDVEHCTCMVDMFARAGHLDKALAVITTMPLSDGLPVWTALMSACLKRGDMKLGQLAFQHVVQLDEKHAGAYVCMNNMYSTISMHDIADGYVNSEDEI